MNQPGFHGMKLKGLFRLQLLNRWGSHTANQMNKKRTWKESPPDKNQRKCMDIHTQTINFIQFLGFHLFLFFCFGFCLCVCVLHSFFAFEFAASFGYISSCQDLIQGVPWVQTCVPWPKRPLFTDGQSVPTTIRYMRTPSMWKIQTTKLHWIRSVTLHGLSLQKIRCGKVHGKNGVWFGDLSLRGIGIIHCDGRFSRSRLWLRISSHGRSTDALKVIGCWGDCDAQFWHTIFFCMAGFAGGTCCDSSASNGETWSSKNCLRVFFEVVTPGKSVHISINVISFLYVWI